MYKTDAYESFDTKYQLQFLPNPNHYVTCFADQVNTPWCHNTKTANTQGVVAEKIQIESKYKMMEDSDILTLGWGCEPLGGGTNVLNPSSWPSQGEEFVVLEASYFCSCTIFGRV